MHSLSDIYTSMNPLSIGLWIVIILLISGIYNKKSSLSLLSIGVLLIIGYKMKGQLNVQSISSYGANMMLISALAYFCHRIKKKSAISVYLIMASFLFFTIHSYIPLLPSNQYLSTNAQSSKYPQLDSEAELLVKFDSQKDLKSWIEKYDLSLIHISEPTRPY